MKLNTRSLVLRLSLVFFLLAFLIAGSQYLLFRFLWVRAADEIGQRLRWSLASELAEELYPLLQSKLQNDKLYFRLQRFERLHPNANVFILNDKGFPVVFLENYRPDTKYGISYSAVQIPVELLEGALEPVVNRSMPVYGPSIFHAERESTFSVARIKYLGKPGYIYIVLKSNHEIVTTQSSETSYAAGAGFYTSCLLFILIWLLGVFLTRNVTRRFRVFSKGVKSIAAGDLNVRVPLSGNDEIYDLGQQINTMADQIESSVEVLKANDTWRREMTAAISHDLKGPISSLSAHLQQMEGMLDKSDDSELFERVDILQKATEILKNYVSDILDLAKLEAGEMVPSEIRFFIQELVSEELFPMFKPVAEAANVVLENNCDESVPAIYGDPNLITRALANLLSNAIQYGSTSQGGRVEIGCSSTSEGVYIYVSDTGPGMDGKQLEELQKPFSRGDSSRSTKTPGAGLGLAITKSIVEAHGQKLQIESEPGVGSRIGFEISVEEFQTSALKPL